MPTLHHPKLCKLLLLTPSLLFIGVAILSYYRSSDFIQFLIAAAGMLSSLLGYLLLVMIPFILISEMERNIKEDIKNGIDPMQVDDSSPAYRLWYNMTFFQFLHDLWELSRPYRTEAKKARKTLANREAVIAEDCLFVRMNREIVRIPCKPDGVRYRHLQVEDDFSLCVYPRCHQLKTSQQQRVKAAVESYLQSQGYTFETILPDDEPDLA